MRISLYLLTILIFFVQLPVFAQQQLPKIYINPKAPGSERQSKFVDSLRFIPLKVPAGLSVDDYNSTNITRDFFLINDYSAKQIVIFSREGAFVKKISYKRIGASFNFGYNEILNRIEFFGNNKNYTLTKKDEIKVKLDWNNPRNRKYYKKYIIDLDDTSFTLKKDLVVEKDILRAYHYYDDYYLQYQISTSELYKDSLDYELKLYRNNQLVRGFFPYNRINESRYLFSEEFIGVHHTERDDMLYITRPYCDTIYKLNGDSMAPAFRVVLPLENTVPPTFFTQPFKSKNERDNFTYSNGSLYKQIYTFIETPQYNIVSIGFLTNYKAYIYQKQEEKTIQIKNIKPDSSHYNLQLLSEYGMVSHAGKYYKLVKAEELLTFFEEHKDVKVPETLEEFLKSNPAPSSLIIVEFKLKT